MPEDLVSSGCSSSFVLEYENSLKAQHISFLFLVLWPIMAVFMRFAQETQTLFATEPKAFYFFIFFLFSLFCLTIPISFQVVHGVFELWPVIQGLLLILIFDQAKQHSVATFQTEFPILKFPCLSGGFYL